MQQEQDYKFNLDHLRKKLLRWRSVAILFAALFAISLIGKIFNESTNSEDYIARIVVEGIILEDLHRTDILDSIYENEKIKALIVHINSPGGSMVGGEQLYQSLKYIESKIPVISVIGTVGASGGYMAALPSTKIYAQKGSITGSIGVMMQTAEFKELSDRIGVKFLSFTSGDLKGKPSPFEKMNEKTRTYLQESINDSFEVFLNMVMENRDFDKKTALKYSDGRIFTGRQALENKLIDAIGNEKSAVKWLKNQEKIDKELPIYDINIYPEPPILDQIMNTVWGARTKLFNFNGIMALWKI